jgi:2-polyprenyl-3-methyl-5-hydroxy-6-metoxy-1,4-benzoquinol methylase
MQTPTTDQLPQSREYPYFEEINEGIIRHLPVVGGGARPRVLDLGSGQGTLGEELRRRGYEVWGVEEAPTAVDRARNRLDRIITGDLTDISAVEERIGTTRFDFLVFSDVLEHVLNPAEILRGYLPLLNESGRVLISLPNVANWQTRFALTFGRFRYQDTGVLDRTHVRFFTFKSAQELVRQAGLNVDIVDCTPLLVRALLPIAKRLISSSAQTDTNPARSIIDSPLYARYQKWIYPSEYRVARLRPGLFAFRIIIVASPGPPHGPLTTVT